MSVVVYSHSLEKGKVKVQCVRSTGWDISDVPSKKDVGGHVTIIIFSNTHRTLTVLSIAPDEDTLSYQ